MVPGLFAAVFFFGQLRCRQLTLHPVVPRRFAQAIRALDAYGHDWILHYNNDL